MDYNTDTKFIEKDILVDERIEGIFRSIEGKVLKEAMDNFAQRDDEIKGLKKCIEQIDELRNIYTNQSREFIKNERILIERDIPENLCRKVIADLNALIVGINDYENTLKYIILRIESFTQRLKGNDNGQIIKEMTEGLHKSYNKYIRENEIIISEFKNIKGLASSAKKH